MNDYQRAIDPISELVNARNRIHTTNLHLEEHGEDTEIIWSLDKAMESIDIIHRWFIRNPDALLNDIFHGVEG